MLRPVKENFGALHFFLRGLLGIVQSGGGQPRKSNSSVLVNEHSRSPLNSMPNSIEGCEMGVLGHIGRQVGRLVKRLCQGALPISVRPMPRLAPVFLPATVISCLVLSTQWFISLAAS